MSDEIFGLVNRLSNEVGRLEGVRRDNPGKFNPVSSPPHSGRPGKQVPSDTEAYVEKLGGRLADLAARLKRLEVH